MSKPLHALIVEDNSLDAELLVVELRRAGFAPDVVRVETEAAYLEQLGHGWDLIFSDYVLPGFSGLRALELLQASGLSLPFIIVSGTIGEDTAVEAMRRGATDYLLKDRLGRLGPAVDHALEKARMEREHRRAQEALAASEERFRQLAENIQEVFWITDAHRQRVLYVSPAYERIWGRTCESLQGEAQGWLETVHPEDRDAYARSGARQADGACDHEYRIVHVDGSIHWIRDRAFPVRDAAGRVYRLVGVAEDITESRELEARMLRAQRMEVIGTLSSGITHDLNNVLGSMLMAASLVKASLRDERDREMLAMVERGAQRGTRMIAQLLAFSRGVEGGRANLLIRPVIEEIAGLIRATFPRHLELRVEASNDLLSVKGDTTQLHQVLMNLCVNARDAMPAGGTLTISAANACVTEADVRGQPQARPGWHVVITVSDTGQGIPAAIIDRIFDPFFTTKETGKGTGLGLSSVLGIIKSHGGFVTVSSAPGRGATFRVFLPASMEPSDAGTVRSAGPFASGDGELVLVVDDEEPIREVTRRLLEAHQYRVITAAGGEEALIAFLQNHAAVRVVLTDMMMPGMDGLSLLRALRVLDDLTVSFVVVSGLEQNEHREEFTRLGVVEVLQKPYPPAQLLKAIERAVTLARTSAVRTRMPERIGY